MISVQNLDFAVNMKKQAAHDVYYTKKRRQQILSAEENGLASPAPWPLEVKNVLCGATEKLEEVVACDMEDSGDFWHWMSAWGLHQPQPLWSLLQTAIGSAEHSGQLRVEPDISSLQRSVLWDW